MTAGWGDDFTNDLQRQPDAHRSRAPQPNVEYQAGQMASVSISLPEVPLDEALWRQEIARVTGLTVPDHRAVELAQVRYWGNPDAPNVYCRFLITDRDNPTEAGPDAIALLKALRKGRRKRHVTTSTAGDGAFVLSWNDWQTGKAESGGTPALAKRLAAAFDNAEQRINELRASGRNLGTLIIIGGGDMVEGCGVFANQPFELDGDRRAQVRNTVAFILAGIDQLAPHFDNVQLLVVGGNHGEHRIGGKRTTRHDNDDAAVFEHAAVAVQRDPELSHVRFTIAQDEPAKTLSVAGWVLGTTHGHVFGRGGAGPSAKAYKWFQGQAAGRHPAGDADVLVTHHFHHQAMQDWGACLWVQTPAMDGGSPHFTDWSGQSASPGMLSFCMTPQKRFTDSQIL